MNLNKEGEKSWKIECGLLYRPFNMRNVCSQHHHWKRPPFRKKKRSRHLEEQCLTQMAFQDYYLLLERMGTWFHYLLRPGSASRHMLWTCFVMLVSSHGPKSRDGGMSNSRNVQRRAWPRLLGVLIIQGCTMEGEFLIHNPHETAKTRCAMATT